MGTNSVLSRWTRRSRRWKVAAIVSLGWGLPQTLLLEAGAFPSKPPPPSFVRTNYFSRRHRPPRPPGSQPRNITVSQRSHGPPPPLRSRLQATFSAASFSHPFPKQRDETRPFPHHPGEFSVAGRRPRAPGDRSAFPSLCPASPGSGVQLLLQESREAHRPSARKEFFPTAAAPSPHNSDLLKLLLQ